MNTLESLFEDYDLKHLSLPKSGDIHNVILRLTYHWRDPCPNFLGLEYQMFSNPMFGDITFQKLLLAKQQSCFVLEVWYGKGSWIIWKGAKQNRFVNWQGLYNLNSLNWLFNRCRSRNIELMTPFVQKLIRLIRIHIRPIYAQSSYFSVTYFVISYRPFVLIGRTESLSYLDTTSVIVRVDQQHLTALLMVVG